MLERQLQDLDVSGSEEDIGSDGADDLGEEDNDDLEDMMDSDAEDALLRQVLGAGLDAEDYGPG